MSVYWEFKGMVFCGSSKAMVQEATRAREPESLRLSPSHRPASGIVRRARPLQGVRAETKRRPELFDLTADRAASMGRWG